MERLTWPQKFARSLASLTGEETRQTVMQGGEGVRSSDTPKRKAEWVRDTMQRLEARVPAPGTRASILQACCCDFQNRKDAARELYLQAGDTEGFLELLSRQKWIFGGILERDPDGGLYAIYTRCVCGWVRAARKPIPGFFCQCSAGYLNELFSAALGSVVQVELVETILQGAERCRFYVPLEEDR